MRDKEYQYSQVNENYKQYSNYVKATGSLQDIITSICERLEKLESLTNANKYNRVTDFQKTD